MHVILQQLPYSQNSNFSEKGNLLMHASYFKDIQKSMSQSK